MRRRLVAAGAVGALLALAGCQLPPPQPLLAPTASAGPSPSPAPAATAASPSASVPPTDPASPNPARTIASISVRPAVNVRTLTLYRDDRRLVTKVWYPREPGRYPIVLFGHGLTAVPAAYADLLSRIADAGFVVAAPTFPHTSFGTAAYDILDVVNQPEDMSAVLDGLLALPPDDQLRQVMDPVRVAAAGHSAGAITALGMFSNDGLPRRDDRIKAALILAGSSLGVGENYAGADAPFLFIHAEGDPVVPYWTALSAFRALPWPRGLLTLTGDEHVGPYLLPADKQFKTVVTASVEFLWWALYGDAGAQAQLLTSTALEQNYPIG